VILFPEGGFRYKRVESSHKYAAKKNLPQLSHLTWPRVGAFQDLVEPSLGVSHIVDLTILYESQDENIAPSILDIVMGRKAEKVYFHYRTMEINETTVLDEEWLNSLWNSKDKLMAEFYANKIEFLRTRGGRLRPIEMSYLKMGAIHLFFLAVCFWAYFLFRLIHVLVYG
jgi:lysophosphatidylglycerol acyltransferase 1